MTTKRVTVLLGNGSFGTKNPNSLSDKEKIQEIFDEYKKHGWNHLDTSRSYGQGTAEVLVAELNYAGQGFVVDTKINSTFAGAHKAENFKKSLDESLQALKTNKVDVLYLHAPDRTTPFEEVLEAANEAYKRGHFERFGLSNYKADEVEKIVQISKEKGWIQPTVYQGMYNMFARAGERELFPVLRQHGISFKAYSPMAGSYLTDDIAKDLEKTEITDKSRFTTTTWVGKAYAGYYFKDSYFKALEQLRDVAHKHGLTVQETAVRWLVHHSILSGELGDSLIFGGKTFSKIKEALDNADKPALPEEVVKVANSLWDQIKEDAGPYTLVESFF